MHVKSVKAQCPPAGKTLATERNVLNVTQCCWRVLPEEAEGKLPKPETEGNILQYPALMTFAATPHKTLGHPVLTMCSRRAFGGTEFSGLEPNALVTRTPTAPMTLNKS
ncbi:hypothetical protein TNCV_1011491 [Trichonephila clavipes]|uniref:Uncharacterized protein n=1 Tax=Trichonephila clavipes TaxID=2585209 RepID=A0A8X6VXB4_TRICX|nr:hypothetical protein TNCV_1011491 [Trichonephila clavipes]